MNINLHNKFEIKIKDKIYTAYNTLLKGVYEKISNLEQYTSHIAIGTGLTKLNFTDTNLTSYLKTFKAQTEEIQSDVSKGGLFIRKVVSIEESYPESFSFSELGLTNTSDFNPAIFNHVVLTDTEGNPVSITRNEGDAMEIRVTIFLELTSSTEALFSPGENILIKRILGEELDIEDNSLYALRGECNLENKLIKRPLPDLTNAVKNTSTITFDVENGVDIQFNARLGEGALEELVYVFGNEVVLRMNALNLKPTLALSISSSCNNSGIIEIDDMVDEITSITSESNGIVLAENQYTPVKYGKKITDKIINLFDKKFTVSNRRFVSKDGSLIAFIDDNQLYIYKYSNLQFVKLNALNMDANNISNLFMNENLVITILTEAPYFKIFEINNNTLIPQNLVIQSYQNTAFDYSWIESDAIFCENGKIYIGLIINNEENTPIVLELFKTSEGYYDNVHRLQLPTAKKVYAINKNNFCEPLLGFITDTLDGMTNYFIEEYHETGAILQESSEIPFTLLNDNQKLMTSGRAVLSQKTIYPHVYVYYYPNLEGVSLDYSTGIAHYPSHDGNYIVIKYDANLYKIYNFHNINELVEFDGGFPDFVNFEEILDFEFIKDVLLVFTSNANTPIYALTIKESNMRIDNPENKNSKYNINYNKYDLYGTSSFEGVMATLNFTFGENKG